MAIDLNAPPKKYRIDYDGFVRTPAGTRMLCVVGRPDCRAYARYENGGCTDHALCQSCGNFLEVPSNAQPRYCGRCVCYRCKKQDRLQNTHVWNAETFRTEMRLVCRGCRPIVEREMRQHLCRRCKRQTPTIYLRDSTKPSLCGDCASAMTADTRNTHYCSFCPSKAATYRAYVPPSKAAAKPKFGSENDPFGLLAAGSKKHVVTCAKCAKAMSCFKGACTPAQPCPKCVTDIEAVQAARVRQGIIVRAPVYADIIPTGYTHASQNPKVPCDFRYCDPCNLSIQHMFIDRQPGVLKFEPADKREDRQANRSRRFLGVEIEVCGNRDWRHYPALRRYVWEKGGGIVHDGSLPQYGYEINSWPAAGDHYLRMVDNLCELIAKCKGWVNDTYEPYDRQAGLHVHVDAQDHTYADMRKLLLMYSYIEPALLRTQPYSRIMLGQDNGHGQNRRYTIPCGDRYKTGILHLAAPKSREKYTSTLKRQVLTNLYGRDMAPVRNQRHVRVAPDVHYYALNIQSWFFRGTIESRIHAGTLDAEEIKAWGMLWAAIVDTTYRMGEAEVRKFEGSTSLDTLLALAPTDEIRTYINSRTKRFAADWNK